MNAIHQISTPEGLHDQELFWPGGLGQLNVTPIRSNFRLPVENVCYLTAAERKRLLVSPRPEKTQRSLAARVATRKMLGQVLALDPASIEFVTGAEGRSRLSPIYGIGSKSFDFSVSYGPQAYCVCLTKDRRVGVDIQRFTSKQRANFDYLFGSYFSRCEVTRLEPQQIWTRMEAYGKMEGKGLGYGMQALYKIALDPRSAPIECHFLDYRSGAGTSLSVCLSGPASGPLCLVG